MNKLIKIFIEYSWLISFNKIELSIYCHWKFIIKYAQFAIIKLSDYAPFNANIMEMHHYLINTQTSDFAVGKFGHIIPADWNVVKQIFAQLRRSNQMGHANLCNKP